MRFEVITLFPEMFTVLDYGITGRAKKKGLISLEFWNPRDYTEDNYHKVDDSPYGGGPGMVMLFEPLQSAIQAARRRNCAGASLVVYLTPQGKLLELDVDIEVSIGDYVLSGGELAAMVVIDSITRHLPGALGDPDSAKQDSFVDNLLDYPHYTRPEVIAERSVPKVLLSGDHAAIARWRRKQALGRTWARRSELLAKTKLTAADSMLLNEFIEETKSS